LLKSLPRQANRYRFLTGRSKTKYEASDTHNSLTAGFYYFLDSEFRFERLSAFILANQIIHALFLLIIFRYWLPDLILPRAQY